MPQASDELRDEWGIDNVPVQCFLIERGYQLLRGLVWKLPNPNHEPSEKELSAIRFLIDEWDFGGIAFDQR